jgi:hypothetical protein
VPRPRANQLFTMVNCRGDFSRPLCGCFSPNGRLKSLLQWKTDRAWAAIKLPCGKDLRLIEFERRLRLFLVVATVCYPCSPPV